MTASGNAGAARHPDEALDPGIRRFVREVRAAWARHPALAGVPPATARRIAEAVRAPWAAGGPAMAEVRALEVPGPRGPVHVRRYDPSGGGGRPALVYLHGGGWTLFSLDTHDRLMREYAARAGVVVLGVDYALAPEAKYPLALEQVRAVLHFAAERGPELGIDSRRLAVGGDSAGGNLALAAALALRDERAPRPPRALLLNYPVLARHSSPEAVERLGGPGHMLGADEMEAFWHNYLRDELDARDPRVCPILAELGGLPPVLLVVAERDLLAEQSFALERRLVAAGVPVELKLFAGASHSFLEAVAVAPLAERALAESSAWLRAALAEPPG